MDRIQIITQDNKKEVKEHGNFAFPVNVSVEKIESYEQGSFLWHWHPEIEITWIMSGELEYQINHENYLLKAGDGMFGNSNVLHAGQMHNHSECTYLSITFHPRFLYGYENSILQTKYVSSITSNDAWSSLLLKDHIPWQKEILDFIKEIYALSQEPPADYELRVHMLLMCIWQKLYTYFSKQPSNDTNSNLSMQRLRDILTYIQTHYDQEINLDNIANVANLCKSECCRFFKKYMNMTIFDYILYYRIQMSLPILASDKSITEVAYMVGFSSPSYYTQIFKRYLKCTPLQYKKSYCTYVQ